MNNNINLKIYGAGSIGNHLAHAARRKHWDVTICDIDQNALDRTKNEIYPSRYGKFDQQIKLCNLQNEQEPIGDFDWIFIGTPPDTHLDIAPKALNEHPKGIMIEKPLCSPNSEYLIEILELKKQSKTKIFVGYDHAVSKSVDYFKSVAKSCNDLKYLES